MKAKATISKIFRFEAAHSLPKHDGQCRRLHGHSYKVIVNCMGPIQMADDSPERGMVIDFARIKSYWKLELEELFDHQNLNETLEGLVPETTAECLAYFICAQFMHQKFPIKSVEVWETETSKATVTAEEVWLNGD